MELGMIGLGRMGANMVRRLLRGGHRCVVYDRDPAAIEALAAEGARRADDLEALVRRLDAPRAIWMMVPAGAVGATVEALAPLLAPGDIVVDGGNSYFRDSIARADALAARGIHFVDAGTSGGIWGLEHGYCLMVGGAAEAVARLEPVLRTLAPGPEPGAAASDRAGTAAHGYLHCGAPGAGHFVKMVHNGIEYGMMAAYAEGMNLLRAAARPARDPGTPLLLRSELDVAAIAELWRHGSVVRSWLLDLIAEALARDPDLAEFRGVVGDSGEGRWTVKAAIDAGVPLNVLSAALFARFSSQGASEYADKLLSAMRAGFGGHREPPHKDPAA